MDGAKATSAHARLLAICFFSFITGTAGLGPPRRSAGGAGVIVKLDAGGWAGLCDENASLSHTDGSDWVPKTVAAATTVVATVSDGSDDYVTLLRLFIRTTALYLSGSPGTAVLIGSLDEALDQRWTHPKFHLEDGNLTLGFWMSNRYPLGMLNKLAGANPFMRMMARKGFIMSTLLGRHSNQNTPSLSVLMIDLDVVWVRNIVDVFGPHRTRFDCQTQEGSWNQGGKVNTGIWFCTASRRVQTFFSCLQDLMWTRCSNYRALEQSCFQELMQHPSLGLKLRIVSPRVLSRINPRVVGPETSALHFSVHKSSASRLFDMREGAASLELPVFRPRPHDEPRRYLQIVPQSEISSEPHVSDLRYQARVLAVGMWLAKRTGRVLLVPRVYEGELEVPLTKFISVGTLEHSFHQLQLRPSNWERLLSDSCRTDRKGLWITPDWHPDTRQPLPPRGTRATSTWLDLKLYDPINFERFATRSPDIEEVARWLTTADVDRRCVAELAGVGFVREQIFGTKLPFSMCTPSKVVGVHDC
mmetsp:Transcript_16189/g.52235  ORF Transcript_16189/g.52235 Transcript_16189/m.52235 type:complete len:530 (-) Transcript_16189:66-1655(-)